MGKKLVSPPVLGGLGSIIVTIVIFFAQGGFENMNPWYIVGLIVGCGLIVWGLVKNSGKLQQPRTSPIEYIKSDLININMIEREIATQKELSPCPKETATQIYNDFISCFGTDIATFTMTLIEKIITNRDIDALIEFFKKFSEILDSNSYGLKVEVENNDVYKASRLDLAQQRLKLKMGKKKNTIIQKNIDRTRLLSYGLNSSILLRGTLNLSPEAKQIVPAIIKTTLEGIETAAEKTLNTMVNDLESEWKVTIYGM